jgi:uncharacterized protein YyaL (SSP411 family)
MRVEQRLMRGYAGGAARQRAFLDDYAYLTAVLLDLFEVSGELTGLEQAIAMQENLDRHVADKRGGGYVITGDEHEPLLTREKPDFDGARPSGNSMALMNLLRLHEVTTDQRYLERAKERRPHTCAGNACAGYPPPIRVASAIDCAR